jgi:hypothetical protein
MATRRRARLVLGLAAVLVVAFIADLLYQVSLRRAAAIESAIQNGPLTISAKQFGSMAMGSSWELQVDSSGNATWKNDAYPTPTTRRFVVTKTQLDELRRALLRERFFDLADSYGERVPDGSTTTLQVSAGDFAKTVELQSLGNWTREPERLREPNRAVRVLEIIRGW